MEVDPALYLKKNVGGTDGVIRVVLGAFLVVWPAFGGWAPWALALTTAIGGSQIAEGLSHY